MKFELTVKLEGKEYVRMGDVLGQAKEEGFTKKYIKESLEATKIKGLGNGLFVLYEDVKNFLAMNTPNEIKVRFEEEVEKQGFDYCINYSLGYRIFIINKGIEKVISNGFVHSTHLNCKYSLEEIYDDLRPICSYRNDSFDEYGFDTDEECRVIATKIYEWFQGEEVKNRLEELQQKADELNAEYKRKEREEKGYIGDETFEEMWNRLMGIPTEEVDKTMYKKMYRKLAMVCHPDKGGTEEDMIFVNQLKEEWGI